MTSPRRRIVLVTGSATGIGRAVAVRFAREGFGVAVNYSRSKKEAEETFELIRQLNVPAVLCQASVADDQAVRKMIDACVKELGGLDVLINNAGTTHFIEH